MGGSTHMFISPRPFSHLQKPHTAMMRDVLAFRSQENEHKYIKNSLYISLHS